jgi:DNA-binding NarL/FixJ family response regulator
MSSIRNNKPIRIGVLTDEPLRLEGLAGIFEDQPAEGFAPLSPVFGNLDKLLTDSTLTFLVVDLNAFPSGVGIVKAICRRRPEMRLIVIGPEGNDRLIMDLALAGARAYLDLKASPQTIRKAVEVVISGSIWAPRRLLSTLIDRLIRASDTSLTNAPLHFTERERQVLKLILLARSNREIARELGIEERTVSAHVGRLMSKMGADNRVDLSIRALNCPLVQSAGIVNCRKGERRQSLAFVQPPITDK